MENNTNTGSSYKKLANVIIQATEWTGLPYEIVTAIVVAGFGALRDGKPESEMRHIMGEKIDGYIAAHPYEAAKSHLAPQPAKIAL